MRQKITCDSLQLITFEQRRNIHNTTRLEIVCCIRANMALSKVFLFVVLLGLLTTVCKYCCNVTSKVRNKIAGCPTNFLGTLATMYINIVEKEQRKAAGVHSKFDQIIIYTYNMKLLCRPGKH